MIRNGPKTRLRSAPGRRMTSTSSLPTSASSRRIVVVSAREERPSFDDVFAALVQRDDQARAAAEAQGAADGAKAGGEPSNEPPAAPDADREATR